MPTEHDELRKVNDIDLEKKFKNVARGKARFQVGKKGVTGASLEELGNLLDKWTVVKVKILKTVLAERRREAVAREVAERLSAHLIEIRGNTFIISRKPIPKYQRKVGLG
ncbi:MAG: YhbY family RNA-binding protein [Promethearchaeota archaeon]